MAYCSLTEAFQSPYAKVNNNVNDESSYCNIPQCKPTWLVPRANTCREPSSLGNYEAENEARCIESFSNYDSNNNLNNNYDPLNYKDPDYKAKEEYNNKCNYLEYLYYKHLEKKFARWNNDYNLRQKAFYMFQNMPIDSFEIPERCNGNNGNENNGKEGFSANFGNFSLPCGTAELFSLIVLCVLTLVLVDFTLKLLNRFR